MLVEENQPLAPFTTFGIGGPARWFVRAETEAGVAEAAEWARVHGVPLFVLGGGSNLLVSDSGFDGLVLHIALRGMQAEPAVPDAGHPRHPAAVIYRAAAGEDWDAFVTRAVTANCAGIECLAGIPGAVGGTPVQNVGAYGQEVASVIHCVRAFDLESRAFVELTPAECDFSYRRSRFNSADRGRFIVTRVDYRLTPGAAPTLAYPDVQRAFAGRPADAAPPTLAETAAAVRHIRQSKAMLIAPGNPDSRSAGSFFKNPVVPIEHFERIAAASACPVPHYPAGQGSVKIPAAWLIEQAGFARGYARGAAAISSRHTLALVNRGLHGRSATAAEILSLAAEISSAVAARFAIRLEREPVLLGF